MLKRTLLLVLALSVAGCLETGDRGAPDPTTATTSEPTPSSATPATPTTGTANPVTTLTACPYIVSVDPATPEQLNRTDNIVAYDDLEPERQAEFDEALTNGSVELDTLPEIWSGPTIITYEGNNYYTVAATC